MIYLLEDDDSIRELVCYSLNKTGTPAVGFSAPSELYSALASELPKLILLDVMLPEEDGLEVLKKLKADTKYENIPVIMLTAKSSEFDKVTALDAGADDYITKPFGAMELVARVKAVLRRSSKTHNSEIKVYKIDDLIIDITKHEIKVGDKTIALTYKEFELLAYLAEHSGAVLCRDNILRDIWGYEFDGENRTVDVHVRTLRQKLGEYADIVETVRGVGYKIGSHKPL